MKRNERRKKEGFRAAVQILSFLLLPGIFEAEFTALGSIVTAIYQRNVFWKTMQYPLCMLLGTVPATILVGRYFCGFFCSFGAMQDFVWSVVHSLQEMIFGEANRREREEKQEEKDVPKRLEKWRYVLLNKGKKIGKQKCFLIKYGVLLFFLLFIWSGIFPEKAAGPWEVFGRYLTIIHWPGVKPLFSIGGMLLLLIIIGSALEKRFFCRYICPMGAVYSLLSRFSLLKIEKPRNQCGKCHLCTEKCSMGMDLTEKDRITGGECIACQQCVAWCPKENAHRKGRYDVLIGVCVTCVFLVASQVLIRKSYPSDMGVQAETADEVNAEPTYNDKDSKNQTAQNENSKKRNQKYFNGTYWGSGKGYRGIITVSVTIEDGKITDLHLEDAVDDTTYLERAQKEIFSGILSNQSAEVDTVSGATYSSRGILEAVQKALKEAGEEIAKDGEEEESNTENRTGNAAEDHVENKGENKNRSNTESNKEETDQEKQAFLEAGRFHNLKDGVYTGSADAFRGDVEVQVTVEAQKVTDISILSYYDTEEYFFKAAPVVINEMKKEQSLNIDTVSGATYSSNGIIHAVANALEIPEDEYAPRQGRDLKNKKKNHGHIMKHVMNSREEYEEKVKEYAE